MNNVKKSFFDNAINIKKMYSFLLAIIPIVMVIRFFFFSFGFGLAILGLFAPYCLFYIFKNHNILKVLPFFILFVYFIFRCKRPMDYIFLSITIIHIAGAFNDTIDYKTAIKTIQIVAIICTFLVIIQTIVFYLFNIRFSYLIVGLMTEDNAVFVTNFLKGTGLYRPSAFFLEPSHYAQYTSIAIATLLLDNNKNVFKTLWVAFGTILTTSGMGIVIFAIISFYYLFTLGRKNNKLFTIFIWLLFGVIVFAFLMQIPFFNQAVSRLFGKYNAIWGRTLYWKQYIAPMSGEVLLFGYGLVSAPDGYMTGLMSLIYYYGIIGFIGLLFSFFCVFVFNPKKTLLLLIGLYFVLLFVSDQQFGYINLVFWISIIVSYSQVEKKYMKPNKIILRSAYI